MATLPSTSQLSRTRSGRLPATTRLTAGATAGLDRNARPQAGGSSTGTNTGSNAGTGASANVPSPNLFTASNVSVFLTNLRLLDLDLRPDWPGITAQTFSGKDQKRRIHAVEWSLYHLFCLWDPEEAHSKMRPYFPPNDQLQSVNLRAALLRGLEKAKKTGALGRDAILRKTMLDECRGDRLEEILAVFSSAVLKAVVAAEDVGAHPAAYARARALESRGYAADRAELHELHALLLAHKASLHALLRQKRVARAQYQDFAELLGLKERSLARRREADKAAAAAAQANEMAPGTAVSHDDKLDLWRLVRNNWSGPEPWMDALLYGGDDRLRHDALLATHPDRVWRRVQAGRLGELESSGADGGLLEQLEGRAQAQQARVQHWEAYRQRIFGQDAPREAAPAHAPPAPAGINLGFGAHESLRPGRAVPAKAPSGSSPKGLPPAVDNTEYAELLQGLQAELDGLAKPARPGQDLLSTLFPTRKRNAMAARKVDNDEGDGEDEQQLSDISDMDEHPIVVQPVPPAVATSVPGSPLHATAESASPGPSPSRPRVLLTKKSLTFTVKAHRHESDEEPEPVPTLRRGTHGGASATAGARVEKQAEPVEDDDEEEDAPPQRPRPSVRRRPQRARSPPIRPPTKADEEAVPSAHSPPLRTPSPSPPPEDDEVGGGDGDGMGVPAAAQHYGLYHTPTPAARTTTVMVPTKTDDDAYGGSSSPRSPSGALADQILASMQNASPSPTKPPLPPPRPRHTLSLAERTRLTMAHASRGSSGRDSAAAAPVPANRRGSRDSVHADSAVAPLPAAAARRSTDARHDADIDNDDGGLVARTRKSMMAFDFEAAQKKAQMERRRSLRRSRQSSVGGGGSAFPPVREATGSGGSTTVVLAEALMSGQQDDAEAIFRSRPKIALSPIPSPAPSPARPTDDGR